MVTYTGLHWSRNYLLKETPGHWTTLTSIALHLHLVMTTDLIFHAEKEIKNTTTLLLNWFVVLAFSINKSVNSHFPPSSPKGGLAICTNRLCHWAFTVGLQCPLTTTVGPISYIPTITHAWMHWKVENQEDIMQGCSTAHVSKENKAYKR